MLQQLRQFKHVAPHEWIELLESLRTCRINVTLLLFIPILNGKVRIQILIFSDEPNDLYNKFLLILLCFITMPRGAVAEKHAVMPSHGLLPFPLRPGPFFNLYVINLVEAVQVHANPAVADIFDARFKMGPFLEHNIFHTIGLNLSDEERDNNQPTSDVQNSTNKPSHNIQCVPL
jgi:hypothetical protein